MPTCLDKKRAAGKILDAYESSPAEVRDAKVVMSERMCFSCRNPIVQDLSIDDILCERKDS